MPRTRTIGSIRAELISKAKEAALCALKVFNDPLIKFKSEAFIVLMIIAWTYLLHAYFRAKRVDYRYYKQNPKRKTHGIKSMPWLRTASDRPAWPKCQWYGRSH
jgi:hypothetical protein